MKLLRCRGPHRGGIMFSELKPCDLWVEKKTPSSTNLSSCLNQKHLSNWNHLQPNHKV